MTKKILSILLFSFVLTAVLGVNYVAYAQVDPLTDFTRSIEGSGEFKTGLQNFEGRPHENSSVEPGASVLTTVVFRVLDYAKYVLGGLAIIYITITGVKLVSAGDAINEVSEKAQGYVEQIIYAFVIVMIADQLVQNVFFGEYGECLASAENAADCAKSGAGLFTGIANFIQFVVATISVLVIVISGFRLVASTGDEEAINRQKKRIGIGILGIILIAISEFLVQDIFFQEGGSKPINTDNVIALAADLTNFAASFIVTLSIIAFIYGGYLYLSSFGNTENTDKAKKVMVGALIAILIGFASFGVVRTFSTLEGREAQVSEELGDIPIPPVQ
jgi:cytochrome bd-type quinol oxidase subunit 2